MMHSLKESTQAAIITSTYGSTHQAKNPTLQIIFLKKTGNFKKSKKSVKYAASFVGARVDAAVQGVSQERFEPEFPV